MSTILEAPLARRPRTTEALAGDNVVVLQGVTWEDYKRYRDTPENEGVRMAYSVGVLLLMTIGRLHERVGKLISLFVPIWFLERSIPSLCCGSMTFQSELREKGLEPDNCWYLSHIEEMQGHDEFDADRHPPIDLAIEIDVTTNSELKLPIYAALRVQELWLCGEHGVRVMVLAQGEYVEQDASRVLPDFPIDKVMELIRQRHAADDTALMRMFREWIRQQTEGAADGAQ
jgi:Uma2 family endonuclease